MNRFARAGIVAACFCAFGPSVSFSAVPAFSAEGQALRPPGSVQALPGFTVVLGADYSPDDSIVLTIGGATVGGNTNANLAQPASVDCGPGLIVSFVARTGNAISLRVTQKTVASAVGTACSISGIEVLSATFFPPGNYLTATWAATTAFTNRPFDPQPIVLVAAVYSQMFAGMNRPFDGVVDVTSPSYRTRFLGDDSGNFPGNDDWTFLTYQYLGVADFVGPAVTLDSLTYEVTGDFSHFDTDGDGDCSNDALGGFAMVGIGVVVPVAVSADCRVVTASRALGIVASTVNGAALTVGPNGTRRIVAPQEFRVALKWTYSLGAVTGTRTDTWDGGAWTLNGFQAFVDYMPYGANVSQTIYLANKGAQTGEIQVDARNEAGAACSFAAGTAGANRVQVLSAAIKAGLEGCYGAGFTGKVQFTVTASIPPSEAELYTGYTVNGTDRPVVVNSSNGR